MALPADIPLRLTHARNAEQMIRGFRQHGAGNCVSIAVIKSALLAFGTTPVLHSARKDGLTYEVVMRDKATRWTFTHAELELAAERAGFLGEDAELLHYACFLFTAMAKRVQIENAPNGGGFESAVEHINDGAHWRQGPRRLGLEQLLIIGPDSTIPNSAARQFLDAQFAGIGQSPKHTWFASQGQHDYYGNIVRLDGWFPWFRRLGRLNGAVAFDMEKVQQLRNG